MKQLFTFAFALVFMAGAAFAQNNEADIKQGYSYKNAQNNVDPTVDGGDDVDLMQVAGGGNKATIYQGRGENDVTGLNGAFTQQDRSMLTVKQDYGSGAGNDVRGEQLGSRNIAQITQHNSGLAETRQDGLRNELYLQQYNGTRNRFFSDQHGDRNYIQFIQRSSVDGSYADILQRGNRNKVDGLSEISSTSTFLGGLSNFGSLTFDGRAEQQSGDQTLYLEQRGDRNELYMSQDGGSSLGENTIRLKQRDGAYGEILQIGHGNLIRGDRNSMALSNDSDLFVSQQGDMNTLRFDQVSMGNTLEVTQWGNDSRTEVQQN